MADETNANVNVNENGQGSQAQAIDYDKIANILDGRMKATEDSVLKGYFKEQGLTGDEMAEAIKMFKADKAAKAPNVAELNAQIEAANARALNAELELRANKIAAELGVSTAKVQYLLKMADTTKATRDGKIDNSKLKESFEQVLKDVPELKTQTDNSNQFGSFKIGANNENNTGNNPDLLNTQLAQAFGVKIK